MDVTDHVAVAKTIDMLIQDERLRYELGCNAMESITKKYNWPSEAEKLVDLYYSLTKKENQSFKKV